MKNSLLIMSVILLTSCASDAPYNNPRYENTESSTPTNSIKKTAEQTTLNSNEREVNEKCLPNVQEVEVIQVLGDTGALAMACDNSSYCMGMTVAVPSNEKGDLWDKKRIKPPKEKCFIPNGTYKYISKDGTDKTVPIIAFGYKYLAIDKAEVLKRLDDGYTPLYEKCVNSKEANSEMCGCFIELIKKLAIEKFETGVTKIDQDSFSKRWFNQSKKDCGKSPEKMKWIN